MRRASFSFALVVATLVLANAGALAQTPSRCADGPQVAIVTLPSVTWTDIDREDPPAIVAAVHRGSIGSMVVRTISSRTTYASGFASIGAGARVDGGRMSGGPAYPYTEPPEDGLTFDPNVEVAGLGEMRDILDATGYSTVVPGALSATLRASGRAVASVGNADPGMRPPAPLGYGRWTLLAGMDERGTAPTTATDVSLLTVDQGAPFGVRTDMTAFENKVRESLRGCLVAVIDQGDLIRADLLPTAPETKAAALESADRVVEIVASSLDPQRDLLLIVTPTSPAWDEATHFGVAVAVGPGFPPGTTLTSATTRRPGLVTLPDIAPTVVDFLGIDVPSTMLGRPFDSEPGGDDRVGTALDLDEESTFVDSLRTPISTGFVIFQIFVYVLAVWLLTRRAQRSGSALDPRVEKWLEGGALALAAFPLISYLAGLVPAHPLGSWGYTALLIGGDVAAVALVVTLFRSPLDRLLSLAAVTLGTLMLDLALGATLQVNTVFSYSLIVAGRFAGIGNIGFAILGASAVLTGALIVHRWKGTRAALPFVAVLFTLVVVFDGAPQFGSDVGGALALVPGLGITWLLLSGRRPKASTFFVGGVAAIVVLCLFLAVDLSRPPEQQTHLARLYQDVRDQGAQVFYDTIARKVRTNLRVFKSTIWTFVVPVALGLLAWLLLWPRDRWRALSERFPKVRAGLIGGLTLAVLGFAVNDSGIVIPAMMFAYLVPVALLTHLSMQHPGEFVGEPAQGNTVAEGDNEHRRGEQHDG